MKLDDITAIIEISTGNLGVKYEIDEEGHLKVNRFLNTSMTYPCEYGFIPNTLAEDGDPADILIISPQPLFPGSRIRVRIIGMLEMSDDKGQDNKLLAVPIAKVTGLYNDVKQPKDLGNILLNKIRHFFIHYKDLELNKFTNVGAWKNDKIAKKALVKYFTKYSKSVKLNKLEGKL